jgi:AcrR family transcriptional regulator
MPKIANHAERRKEVCEAVWEVIARDGLEATTLRAIALELGMTTGVLMHYFRDRDDLIEFAIEEVMNRLEASVDQHVVGKSGLPRLEALILAGLPIGTKAQRGWKIWLAITGASVGKAALLAQHQRRYAMLRQRVAKEIKLLKQSGVIAQDINVTAEADASIELTDGIGVGWFIDPERYTQSKQRAAVKRFIDRLAAK